MINARKVFLFIVVFLALTDFSILWDIPVLRQLLGFLYLTIVPGWLILYIFRLNKLGLAEKVVLAVGLSVSFLLLFGLAINSSLFALGYARPLSTPSLLVSFSLAIVVLSIGAYLRNKNAMFSLSDARLTTGEKALLILPVLFPLLSIVGMQVMNLTDNNVLLIAQLFIIAAYVVFISLTHRRTREKVYPIAILLISLSLLLPFSLRTSHIIGSDTLQEYYHFQVVSGEGHWGLWEGRPILNSTLSISLLPAIYQSWLNIAPEYLFKILYSLLLSILPLVVYILSRRHIGSLYALLASIFFMSQVTFLWIPAEARQSLASLFFALAVMTIVHDDINELAKKVFFIVFSASAVVSHYSTTFVVLFIFLLALLGMQILRILSRILSKKKAYATRLVNSAIAADPPASDIAGLNPQPFKQYLTVPLVALFFAMMFFWLSQITRVPFSAAVGFVYSVLGGMAHFFVLETRSGTIQGAVGAATLTAGVPQWIKFVASWTVLALLTIGLLATIAGIKRMVALLHLEQGKPDFMPKKFGAEFLALAVASYGIVALSVVLPYVSLGYASTRVDFLARILLSQFTVLGGIIVARYLLRAPPRWLLLPVLIPYFLSASGALYQLYGVSDMTLTLSSKGYLIDTMIIHTEESASARWLKQNMPEESKVWAERMNMLASQSLISFSQIEPLILAKDKRQNIDDYIYLRSLNVLEGEFIGQDQRRHDLRKEFPDLLTGRNKLYANGGSEIYR